MLLAGARFENYPQFRMFLTRKPAAQKSETRILGT